ncbi:MAG: hypothetical protein KAT68_18650 [Bacteroidales bacterium]|nr:hypothetical protein [Bacteroidales bacterium]
MALEKLKKYFQYFDQKKIKIERKYFIFLIFVLICTIFWLLNALSKEYTTTIRYPVKYINFPQKKILVNKLPNNLEIKVNSFGFTLLKYKLKVRVSFAPVVFNLSTFTLRSFRGKNNYNYFILTKNELDKISKQLSSDLEVLQVYPDTIYFHLADIVKKKVEIIPDVYVNYDKETFLNGKITVSPDSINVWGPETIIDTLKYIKTKYQKFDDVNKLIKRNVGLSEIKKVKYSDKRVVITIPAEKYTEGSKIVPIEVINLPDSLTITIFPKEINVTYMVALSNYDKIQTDDFKVLVDYKNKDLSNYLKVKLVKSPEFITKVKFKPVKTDYIIEKL